jgi:hypothetical protein
MGIERQGNYSCYFLFNEQLQSRFHPRLPVAHARYHFECTVAVQGLLQSLLLTHGDTGQRGAATDKSIVFSAFRRPPIREEPGQGPLQPRRTQSYDVSIREEIEKERGYIRKGFGAAEIEENDTDLFVFHILYSWPRSCLAVIWISYGPKHDFALQLHFAPVALYLSLSFINKIDTFLYVNMVLLQGVNKPHVKTKKVPAF